MSVGMRIAELVFWASALALGYTYVGYPLLLVAASLLRPRAVRRDENFPKPYVSVIITAYNEERDLARKLENTLAIDYPKDKLEIIVASDCSDDRTDEIVLEFAARTNNRVRLHRQPTRQGKTAAQNAAVEIARGEIILFSDATTDYAPDVLRKILPSFADETIGCVAGRLNYIDPSRSSVGHGARSYWGYETFLKMHESRVRSLIGASGCMYAVRRRAYIPLYPEACSDFIVATKMVEQGLRAVFEPGAVCSEETNRRASKELKMRVRVITQTYTDLWRHRHMMNPLRAGFFAVELISHKVMRYLVPVFLIALFVSSCALAFARTPREGFYVIALCLQFAFYAVALLAMLLEVLGVKSSLLAMPQYFVLANLASLIAAYKFARGERYAYWQPQREPTQSAAVAPTTNAVRITAEK